MDYSISVIVPVYNVSQYLDRCIESLLNQTFSNIEIILIDDGSTDQSGEMCDEYAKQDERIVAIHQQNQGLGAARNRGISAASGEFVMFVDSDDWVSPDYCSHPYQTAREYNADLVLFGYSMTKEKAQDPYHGVPFQRKAGFVTKEEAMTLIEEKDIGPMAWNKLYKRSLFQTLRYITGKFHEDEGTTYKAVHSANTIYYLPEHLYYYDRSRKGRIMANLTMQNWYDRFDIFFQRVYDLESWGYDCSIRKLNIALLYLIEMGRNENYSEESRQIILNRPDHLSGLNWKWKIVAFIYLRSPVFFDFVCRITGMRVVHKPKGEAC